MIDEFIGKTPVVRLERIVEQGCAEVWVKLEAMNPGGSIKDRPALAMIVDAERRGLLRPGDTIVEPTSGNTGIGLAQVAAARGYKLILTLPAQMSLERKRTLTGYGARLVLTDPELYFGSGQNPVTALYIWRGGLGVWGAIAFGALGGYIACRRRQIKFRALADALAPGIVIAQGIGRLGNWFNQELYGRPTDLPWGLEIDADHRRGLPEEYQGADTFHPTFLYEALWNFGVAGLVIWAVA